MKSLKNISIVFLVACVIFGILGIARSQTSDTGALTGTVMDAAGAVVPGVEITITNQATGISRTATTDASGLYRIPLLPPGTYRIDASKAGFKVATRSGVVIVVTETATLNLPLAVGASSQTVTVSANTQLLQTESSALGRTVSAQSIVALPLSSRNFTQILALSPGVEVELPDASAVGTNSQNVSSDGARPTFNNFEFNGVDAVNFSENSASGFSAQVGLAVPAPDTIQEFKAQTSSFDASEGYGAGANVDIVSKSGTNSFHGTLWEFLRNTDLNANNFFLKRAGQPRPVLKQNQFGFVLGGPIRRNKTFFFLGYQGTTQRNGESSLGFQTALLPAALTNDRSAAALGREFGGQSGVFGGVAIAPDGSNINPVALKLLNFKFANGAYAIPTPQIVSGGVGKFSYSSPVKFREDQYSANIDHAFSDHNQLSERFFYAKAPQTSPFYRQTLPGWGLNLTSENLMAVLSDTHTFTSNLVNVARVGYIRFHGVQHVSEPISNADVGITSPGGQPGIPEMLVLGLFSLGPDLDLNETDNAYIAEDNLAWVKGRHSLRFGAQVKRDQTIEYPEYNDKGVLVFLSFPDFLLGQSGAQNGSGISNVFETALLTGILQKDVIYNNFSGYVQDDYKASSRLTLNLGLRYEFFGPPTDTRGRLTNFVPSLADPVPPPGGTLAGLVFPSNYHGALPAGVTRQGEPYLWNRDFKDFAPRVGFALRLRDNPGLVLRGGYGIYYQRLTGQVSLQTIASPPFALNLTRAAAGNAAATFQQPLNPPAPPLSAFPVFIPLTGSPSNPAVPNSDLSQVAIDRSIATPYLQSYNLNLQYEFAPNTMLELGYVGSKGTNLGGAVGINQAEIATPQNPVHGVVTTTTLANVLQRAPIVGADTGGTYEVASPFISNYNSLQASVTKRMSYGLQFLASYTWSRALDDQFAAGQFDLLFPTNDQTNVKNSYGPTGFDRTHRFVLSFVYQTPKFGGSRPLRLLASNWQFSGLTVFQSGVPITVVDSTGGSAYGAGVYWLSRAECTGKNQSSSGSVESRLNGYFNPAAFTTTPVIGDDGVATGYGNCGSGSVRGPDQRNQDLAIERSFRIVKESNLLFRTEFFNLTNTANFGGPVSDHAAGPAFGVISSTANNPRIIQFALKYQF